MQQKEMIDWESTVSAPNYLPIPVVLSRGKDVWLWDTDGKKYLDMMSAYSAQSLGHCNKAVIQNLCAQAAELAVCSRAFHTDKLAPFLQRLCELTGQDQVIPMNTGAEAVETAIKSARRWGYMKKKIPEGQAKIIVCDQNFHGRTTTIISFSSEAEYRRGFAPFDNGFISIPFGDAQALRDAITPDVCAFLVEPIQGEGGILIPPDGWMKEVKEICEANNVLLIFDEVQTGLGRTGKLFAYQHEDAHPDGLILGKALGGGIYPVSAFLGRQDVMECMTYGSHGSTFGGNPLACSVGMHALELIVNERLADRSAELGDYLLDELRKIKSLLIKEVRGRGLFIGVEIDPKYASAREVCEKYMQNGCLSKETHETVVRLAPPLTITREDLDLGIDIFAKTLMEIESGI